MASPSCETLRGAAGEVGGQLGVAGGDHGPAVDKDLGADLFGHHLAVQGDRAAARGRDALLETQVGGVLGGVAHAAPPEDRALLDDVVEPGLADLRGREVAAVAVVRERAQEGKGAGDVVVGDDQGHVFALVDVVPDLAEFGHDAVVGPAFEGAAEIDADNFAEHAGVGALEVVIG